MKLKKGENMNLPSKTVQCKCGQEHVLEKKSRWCNKCGKRVFYHEKDNFKNTLNNIYVYTVVISSISFITYAFIELVLVPMSKL